MYSKQHPVFWVCLLIFYCVSVWRCAEKSIIPNLNEENAAVTLTSTLHTLPTLVYVLLMCVTMNANLFSVHHFIHALKCLFFFHSLSLHSSSSLSLLNCLFIFGSVKWIPHRWPNFSVDFLKLISCCILVWIPNENCGKIGKLLIRWNDPLFPSCSLLVSLF